MQHLGQTRHPRAPGHHPAGPVTSGTYKTGSGGRTLTGVTTAQTLIDPDTTEPGPPWPTKIVVLLREGLLPWQELNVTAFLVERAWPRAIPELIGAPVRGRRRHDATSP